MAFYANPKQPFFMERPLKLGERIWYAVSWDRKLLDPTDETISGAWNVPVGYSVVEQRHGVVCEDSEGNRFNNCSMVLLETTLTDEQTDYIECQISVSDGEIRKNGFYLTVKDFTTI